MAAEDMTVQGDLKKLLSKVISLVAALWFISQTSVIGEIPDVFFFLSFVILS